MPQPLFAVAELAAAAPPWRVAVGRAGSILRALLGSREIRVVRRVARVALWPVNFVLGNILSGNWVPSGPWIVVWSSFAFAANVQTYKQIVGLSWRLAKAQVAAWRGDSEEKSRVACELCDTIIGLILKFDSNSPEDIDCGELCPFGMGKCVRTCESIVEAIATSSHYPCVAAQLCADELPDGSLGGALGGGDVTCAWDKAERACAPRGLCTKAGSAPAFVANVVPGLARCELHPGLELWGKYQSQLSRHAGALVGALAHQPKCGEPGASPVFCVQPPGSAASKFSERASAVLVLLVGILRSVRAIETNGGDDDKLMLTFWIVFVLCTLAERVLVVLLSRLAYYYHAKLAVVLFITYFDGAEVLYRKLRRLRYRVAHSSIWRKRMGPLFLLRYLHEDVSTETYAERRARAEETAVSKLEEQASFGALAVVADYANRTSLGAAYEAAVRDDFGPLARDALVALWDKDEFAFLYARVHGVTDLAFEPAAAPAEFVRPLRRSSSGDDLLKAALADGTQQCYCEMHLMRRADGADGDGEAPPVLKFESAARRARRHSALGDIASSRVVDIGLAELRTSQSTPDRTFHRRIKTPKYQKLLASPKHPRSRSLSGESEDDAAAAPGPAARFVAALAALRDRIVAAVRALTVVESFMGHFEGAALASAVSERRGAADGVWDADLELKLLGGGVDDQGKWHNPEAAFLEVLVQVWAYRPFAADAKLGEARVKVCILMHGGPVKLENLALKSGDRVTGRLTTTMRLAPS